MGLWLDNQGMCSPSGLGENGCGLTMVTKACFVTKGPGQAVLKQ
jgi:hypothetical protein